MILSKGEKSTMSVHSRNLEESEHERADSWISDEPPSPVRNRSPDDMRGGNSSGADQEVGFERFEPIPRASVGSRRERRRSIASGRDSVNSLKDADEKQLLGRIFRSIEDPLRNLTTVPGL
jgi:hypothetical protein